ncbi:MAG: right-handed parallel beta-helix repeat-containing protein [Labilithrix sp.]|nr:right-handed parallel beta-helix repeat-containing protein [Labilithrix sp.]
MRLGFALVLAGALGACAPEAAPSDPAPAGEPGPGKACADGFALDADGACVDLPAPASCPAGSRPRLGASACERVGWSGWEGSDAAPGAACEGATREAVGEANCVPIGDCVDAVPPGAIRVGPSGLATIAEAVAAAPDGATIAIDAGLYEEALVVTKPLVIVGRCASMVEIRSPAGNMRAGVDVRAGAVTVRGVTLTGHVDGVAVARDAVATIERVVVRDARYAGIYVEGRATIKESKIEDTHPHTAGRGGFDLAVGGGAEASVEDSALSGGVQGVFSGGPGTKLALSRVVITRQAPDPAATIRPVGVAVLTGARVSLSRTILRDLVADGAVATEAGGTAELDETIVRDVRGSGSSARGYGLLATLGGHVVARKTSVTAVSAFAVMSRDEGSSMDLASATITVPAPATPPPESATLTNDGSGGGISISKSAKSTLDDVAVIGAWGFGVYADGGASLAMKHSFVDAMRAFQGADGARMTGVGLTVNNGAVATISDVTISRCAASGITVGKRGNLRGDRVLVRDVVEGAAASTGAGLSVGAAGEVDLDASAIDGATASGVIVTQGGGSTVRLSRSSIHGTRPAREGFAHGVTVRLDARVTLEATSIVDNPGIGVAADGGRALVHGGAVARNAVGIHAQGGSFLIETDDADAESLGDGEVRVAPSTRFVSNGTRVGSGEVPLPAPALP